MIKIAERDPVAMNSIIERNSSGVRADASAVTTGNVRATIASSSVSGSINDGAASIASVTTNSILMIDRSTMANSTGVGVIANGGTVLLGASVVTGNGGGLNAIGGGTLFSYNNNVNGNANDNVAVRTVVGLN